MRRFVRKAHLWLGLTLGLYLSVMGLSGSVLVFGESLEPALNPQLHHIEPTREPMPWRQAVATIRDAYPDRDITRVLVPESPEHAIVFWLGKWNGSMPIAYLDPYTGAITGEDTLGGSLIGWMRYFHIYLYAGSTGFIINGVAGLIVMILLGTGLYLWWPNQLRLLGRRLWVAWRAPWARLTWDAHQALGIWALPLLALIALTGVVFPFHTQVNDAVHWLFPEKSQQSAAQGATTLVSDTSGNAPVTLDTMVSAAEAAVPGGRLVMLNSVDNPDRPLSVMLMEPGGENWYRYAIVSVDRDTGKVVNMRRQTSTADRVMGAMYPLHTGRFGGVWTKSLFVLVGLTPSALLVTGTLIWVRRRTT